VALKKTLFRIYVKSGWNRLHVIPAGRLAQSQVLLVSVSNDNRTIICTYAATCAQVQVYIPGLPTYLGGEFACFTLD
jgi:hypothetical protein